MARASTQPLTAEEFFALSFPDSRTELVRGEVVWMSPANAEHGVIAMRIGARLHAFVESHGLGAVCAAETGFLLGRDPDTVRAPDAAFVSCQRIGAGPPPRTFWPFAPDLAVEVVSPSARARGLEESVRDWFAGGARRVCLLYPQSGTVHVFRSPSEVQVLGSGEMLSGEDVLPGFSCAVAALFE
ncbi:MAG TPA: Uma2 family endonuclease [Thermoanaerobaculia bacterium]|nr:Uma2 family endonuclease [Thermoanaerobaculia bacterium]